MAALQEIIRFAGWSALLAGLAIAILDFWTNSGSEFSKEVFAKSAMLAVGVSFMVLLVGAVIFQVLNATFPFRVALVAGAVLALPVAIAFMGWAATSMKPETEALLFGAIALLIFWLVLALFASCVMYLFPRFVGLMPLGR